MNKYLMFERVQPPKKKTLDIFVRSLSGSNLGIINWYAPWRRYVFHPTLLVGTSFDSDCLKDITNYLDNLMEIRKK